MSCGREVAPRSVSLPLQTDAKASQKTPVDRAVIAAPGAAVMLLQSAESDLRAVGRIGELSFAEAEQFEVRDIVLTAAEA